MKLLTLSVLLMIITLSCESQTNARKQAEEVQKTLKALQPGTEPTSADGWMMTCTIDGKKWSAASIMPPEAPGRIIGYYDQDYISFPRIQKRFASVGMKKKFGENYAVDFVLGAEEDIYGGYSGEIEVTSLKGDWMEGRFNFVASSARSAKKHTVTNGFFRIKVLE